MILVAFSSEVDVRWSSLNQSICSALAPGMNLEVKTCRYAGLLRPHPCVVSVSNASRSSNAAGPRFAAPLAYAPYSTRWLTLWVSDGVFDRDRSAL